MNLPYKQILFGCMVLWGTLLMLYPGESWVGILLNSLLIHALVFYLAVAAVAIYKRLWWVMGAMLICLGMSVSSLPTFADHKVSHTVPTYKKLKVAHYNVWALNNDYQELIDNVLANEPDLVSFQEVTYTWAYKLSSGLGEQYPYQYQLPHHRTKGLSIFSKRPINDVEWVEMTGMPNFTGKLEMGNEEILIIASHARNPIHYSEQKLRNRHLQQIGEMVKAYNGPSITLGDYNTVPWDNSFKSLCKNSNLNDSRRELSPTYTAGLPFGPLIPIDHILYNERMNCHSFEVMKDVGSDHLGIMGVYSVKKQLVSNDRP